MLVLTIHSKVKLRVDGLRVDCVGSSFVLASYKNDSETLKKTL